MLMDSLSLLLGSSTILAIALFILLVFLISRRNGSSVKAKRKVSSDLKKIKDQINGD